jgi:hypothetical protein
MGIAMRKIFIFIFIFISMDFFCGNIFAKELSMPQCERTVYIDPQHQIGSQCQMLKRWALSACLADSAQDKKSKLDAAYTASIHAEATSMDMEEPVKFNVLIRRYLAKDYTAPYLEHVKSSSDVNTEKCFDLYDSAELDSLVMRTLKVRKNRWPKRVSEPVSEAGLKPMCRVEVYAAQKKQIEPPCHLLKRRALGACLAYATDDKKTKLDILNTIDRYDKAASVTTEEAAKFDILTFKYLAKDYRSIYFENINPPPELNTGKCLDLYDSLELDLLVTRILEARVAPANPDD